MQPTTKFYTLSFVIILGFELVLAGIHLRGASTTMVYGILLLFFLQIGIAIRLFVGIVRWFSTGDEDEQQSIRSFITE